MEYKGEIKSYRLKKKKKVNVKAFLLWYLGVVISFVPIFLDVIVFLSENDRITEEYWIEICLKGDVLWILATLIVLTVIDYFSDNRRKKGFELACAIVGMIMWGVVSAVWIIFKYIYTEDYKRNFPVAVTLIVIGITLTCCTPLQVKTMEVKG